MKVSTANAIRNNSDVNPLALTLHKTKLWCAHHGWGGITLVESGDFIETFAGDALRLSNALGFHQYTTPDGLLAAGIPAHTIKRYAAELNQAGLNVKVIHKATAENSNPGFTTYIA